MEYFIHASHFTSFPFSRPRYLVHFNIQGNTANIDLRKTTNMDDSRLNTNIFGLQSRTKKTNGKNIVVDKYARWSIGAEQLMKEQIKR
ncbi:hypothetical protein [Treponema endosymbiont of Eucomonympha sp.]|uniref:hypothetical protein n=1 Tax=Treponema endosymbiont of Eucomonympha sp. TaxID=1580831 RepID=UPI000AE546BC|nr:hypothetical protein [Treponema endosymbiont of Eucomonympha sp.]